MPGILITHYFMSHMDDTLYIGLVSVIILLLFKQAAQGQVNNCFTNF